MNAPPDESAFTGGSDPAGREGQSPPQDSRRYEPPSRTEVLVLEEGQRLVTDFITIVAMRGKDSVEVECNCTEATPDRPGCEMSIDKPRGESKLPARRSGGATLAARRYACLPEG
jgi:hypothetical protein